MIAQFFRNKHVLLTGVTGFVGKVMLEKLLWSCSDIARVYVFIRPKKGADAAERFSKDVLESPCFDRLRKRHANFQAFVESHLRLIPADLQKERLGLSLEDEAELAANLEVILNVAASVDFNLRLDQALQINTFGAMRMLELAQKCPKICIMVHTSTAYVNCTQERFIDEKIYPMPKDPTTYITEVQQIAAQDIERETARVLGKFPNTYTFTKNIGEQMLARLRNELSLVIVRPTIIGGSLREPYQGWVDNVSAAGAFYLSAGLGLLKVGIGNLDNIGDQIPVDFVCNTILVAAALQAHTKTLKIVNIGTSAQNPVTWRTCRDATVAYFSIRPPEKAIAKCSFHMYQNPKIYEAVRFAQRTVPAFCLVQVARLTGNPSFYKNAMRFQKALKREQFIAKAFYHFTKYEWIFSSQGVLDLLERMTPADKEEFCIDVGKVDWRVYMYNYMYGLQKWVLKEQVQPITDSGSLDMNLDAYALRYFSDILWAYKQPAPAKVRGLSEMKFLLLNAERVQSAIQRIASRSKPAGKTEAEMVQDLQKRAHAMVSVMCADLRIPALRVFAWFLRKVWRRVYDKVVIDPNAVKALAAYRATHKGPIVFAPTHRSYVDFLIVSYILFANQMPVPHIAAGMDFLSIKGINHLLRMCGAFFIKRKLGDDELYSVLLTEYVQRLLKDNQSLEFFVEGTRSRTGKTLPPKFGMLNMCTELYFDRSIPDLHIIPVTISYDRVLEGETFPFELLGEEKVKESLGRMLRAFKVMNMNFGDICVNFGKPISLSDFETRFPSLQPRLYSQDSQALNRYLGLEIAYNFQDLASIMPTALVSAVLLTHRHGIGEEALVAEVGWLRQEIASKKYRVNGISQGPSATAVQQALAHINDSVVRKKDLFETKITIKNDFRSILMLSYYRNGLMHVFFKEAYCACALFAFGEKLAYAEGVPRDRLREEALFLSAFLRNEFVVRDDVTGLDTIDRTIDDMLARGVLLQAEENVRFATGKEMHAHFLCSLLWPLLDCYWAAVTFAQGLKNKQALPAEKLLQHIQMFTENMYDERVILFHESCSLESIKNALGALKVRTK